MFDMLGGSCGDVSPLKSVILFQTKQRTVLGIYREDSEGIFDRKFGPDLEHLMSEN